MYTKNICQIRKDHAMCQYWNILVDHTQTKHRWPKMGVQEARGSETRGGRRGGGKDGWNDHQETKGEFLFLRFPS